MQSSIQALDTNRRNAETQVAERFERLEKLLGSNQVN